MPEKTEAGIIHRFFLEHPAATGETYTDHLLFTLKIASYLLVTGIALVIHGFVPKLYQTTTSDRLAHLAGIMQERRNALDANLKK